MRTDKMLHGQTLRLPKSRILFTIFRLHFSARRNGSVLQYCDLSEVKSQKPEGSLEVYFAGIGTHINLVYQSN